MSSGQEKDVSLTVTSFYMKYIGVWVANNRHEQLWRNIAIISTVLLLAFAAWILVRDTYYSWGNFSEFIYATCNAFTLILVLCKILILFARRRKFVDLLLYAQKNFWHSNYDCHENRLLTNCRRTCTYLICIFSFFAQGTAISYCIFPIVKNIGRNESERILPFNLWLNLPLSMTPYFEIIFTLQMLTAYHVSVCYLCVDNFLCIMNLHVASQFHILQYRLKNMHKLEKQEAQDEFLNQNPSYQCYERFKSCIKQHQALIAFCNNLEDVFTVIVLGQVLLFSILICLDGFLVLMEDAPTMKRLIFAVHITGCMCQLLMFTYSCDCLIRESTEVATAVYSGPWTSLSMDKEGRMLRRDLSLVILRSRVPCCLTASGFFVVSLETYTKILSTAVSYFTLLRQY